jgi:translocation and assembly module TamB
VENFLYQADKGKLTGQAKVKLPNEKQQLVWNADLKPRILILKAFQLPRQ